MTNLLLIFSFIICIYLCILLTNTTSSVTNNTTNENHNDVSLPKKEYNQGYQENKKLKSISIDYTKPREDNLEVY